ncbi:MCE family protein [Rhodococcus qingshengii]|uniref:MCE family protein n=1 Tax=Rhodococcus qingshengii TaxID=334542 RepID=UPI00364D0FD2
MRPLFRPLLGFSVFVVLSLLSTLVIWSTLTKPIGGDSHTFTARFTDVSGLRTGDDVRMAGVRVGRVESVSLEGTSAVVAFKVVADQDLYSDTEVAVKYQNLTGQRYVGLSDASPADAGDLQQLDQIIGTDRTHPSFDVTQLLNGFQPLFSTLDASQINSLSANIVWALQGDRISISALLAQTTALANSVANNDAVIGGLVESLTSVLATVTAQSQGTDQLIDSLSVFISDLNEQSAVIGSSIEKVSTMSDDLSTVLASSRGGLEKTVNNAQAITSFIVRDGSALASSLPGLEQVFNTWSKSTANGSYWNIYACNLDISLYGVLFPPNVLAQVAGNTHSKTCRP